MAALRTLIAAALTCLAGCRLVDQRTFDAAGVGPDQAALARANLPDRPLAVVHLDRRASGPDDIGPELARAVALAEARKPDAAFDVVAPVAPDDDARIAVARADLQQVAAAMQTAGVLPERLFMALRGDTGAAGREVRVYVH